MSHHIVSAFDTELESLQTMLAQMGGQVEEQLDIAVEALKQRDTERADRVIAFDKEIDALEIAIQERALTTLATRQPMAADLRAIMVAIRVASDLERIGDLAKNIAKRTHAMTAGQPRQIMVGVARMNTLAMAQLNKVLDSYATSDVDAAVEVWRDDKDIDALYNSVFRELLTYMMEDPRTISLCTHLLFAAKNIERIGDHATNMAENVYYRVHGEMLTDDRPKSDTTSMTAVELPEETDEIPNNH